MSVEEQDDIIEMLEKLKAKKLCVFAFRRPPPARYYTVY